VRGKIANLFSIIDIKKYGTALENVVGGKLWNVVVENERVSKELIKNNCVNYNVTYIPLNNIRGEVIPMDMVSKMK
jgi:structural maintenance of chromosome 2